MHKKYTSVQTSVKLINKTCKPLKCINFNGSMFNSTLITVNFTKYYIIHTCHFLM